MVMINDVELVKLRSVFDVEFWDILKLYNLAQLAPLQQAIMCEKAYIEVDEDFEPEDVPYLTMRANVLYKDSTGEPKLQIMVVRKEPEASECYISRDDLDELGSE
jgi:hypothetical protein